MNRREIFGMAGLGTAASFSQLYPEGANAAYVNRDDSVTRAKFYADGTQLGWVTRAEIRERENLP